MYDSLVGATNGQYELHFKITFQDPSDLHEYVIYISSPIVIYPEILNVFLFTRFHLWATRHKWT